ncbi:Ubiquitin-conjugating enzyme E2 [Arabidopsis thaliana x Arabidopsis arenosa]|uniref:E2 ubiquitin-conjugating enzyme n=1 Tax=Arabidopsis thaliana x Arabidopsis arenosa TaxID=1240361 RepID=A0A8T2A607_9BRAS|nr:Ubiquitin-conjugating enzyme E2 [Arabidopsis thaliana x Arabidopsis arenosa]
MFFQKLKFRKLCTSKNSHKISPATVSKSPATVSKSSEKRLRKEFQEEDHILKAHVRASLPSPENISRWEATVNGPVDCPYENGVFTVSVHIPPKYPFQPPKITFKTKIFHPNISESGEIFVDILGSRWSSALTINLVLLSVCSILSNPVEPFLVSNHAARLYRKDRKGYEKVAREWTQKYAKG